MKLPKRIRIVDRRLGREAAVGLSTPPDLIEIHPEQHSKERLDTVIHETLHLLLPKATEQYIRAYSARLTDVLWRDRWRRVEK